MAGTRDDGGFAFPVPHSIDGNWNKEPIDRYSGMSLRDWFAGQALNGLIGRVWNEDGKLTADQVFEIWAKSSYAVADAMLAVRSKPEAA